MQKLAASDMINALTHLSGLLPVGRQVRLIAGGGGAMVLAHAFPIATSDIDAIPTNIAVDEFDVFVKQTAMDLNLPGDWLNPYFSTFSHVLPLDYEKRLIRVFSSESLVMDALGRTDLLVMKCFAHRPKDISHALALVRGGADLKTVEARIEALKIRNIPGCAQAFEFLDEIIEKVEE
jgi:hypothetical protein